MEEDSSLFRLARSIDFLRLSSIASNANLESYRQIEIILFESF